MFSGLKQKAVQQDPDSGNNHVQPTWQFEDWVNETISATVQIVQNKAFFELAFQEITGTDSNEKFPFKDFVWEYFSVKQYVYSQFYTLPKQAVQSQPKSGKIAKFRTWQQ